MATLADIRAKLAQQEKKNTVASTPKENIVYPHWNLPVDGSASIRFLPDADPDNTFFWVERQLIKLPFNGIKGNADAKKVVVQVPCMEMYGESCPILAEVRPWYKDETLKEMANAYWKKRSYLFQGFVRKSAFTEESVPESPIRRFLINSQIFGIIKRSLVDPDLEESPTDYVRGLDFHINKTQKGKYAEYNTSTWARRESALTEEEREAINKYGLFDLKEFLPKKPSDAELNIIKEMFDASVEGKPYDVERWADYYRPWGVNSSSSTQNNPEADEEYASASNTEKQAPQVTTPIVEQQSQPAKTTSKDKAQDILAIIRAKQNTQN